MRDANGANGSPRLRVGWCLAGLLVAAGFGLGVFSTAVVGLVPGNANASDADQLALEPGYDILEATWDLIQDEYVAVDSADDQELIYGAAKGMVDALGDAGHSTFLDPEEAESFRRATNGELIGIGVQIDFEDGVPVVVAPIETSPAAEAGVQAGDRIVEIDGVVTAGLSDAEVSGLLRGDAGTSVTLTLQRDGLETPVVVDLERRKIELDPVVWSMLDDGTMILRIRDFSAGASEDVAAALEAARDRDAARLILDLRNNPGGLVSELVAVASQFMDEGSTIFLQQDRDGELHPKKTDGQDGLGLELPIVVLVNRGSASSAEILAAALRDNDRATVIGERTYGTGTVLTPFALADGSSVVLGTSLWLTPSGELIWKRGLDPDAIVRQPGSVPPIALEDGGALSHSDIAQVEDTQLLEGLRRLTTGSGAEVPVKAGPTSG